MIKPQKVRKAVFPVAGFGTRFLPATKAMPKELLPILDKPLIQYAAEEAVKAGIDTLIFVTGRHKRAIEDHFDRNPDLELALRSKGKDDQANMVRNILPMGVQCIFVRQSEQLGLGDAVLCAERAVGNEPFAVLLADDFLTYFGEGTTSDLVSAFKVSGKSQISYMEIDGRDISNYGVLVPGFEVGAVDGLIEKPNHEDAPSNMASIGRYVLQSSIFKILHGLEPGFGGEVQLSDAINILAKQGEVGSVQLQGQRFDCGVMSGYVAATIDQYGKNKILTEMPTD